MRIPTYTCDTCMKNSPDTKGWFVFEKQGGTVPSLRVMPFDASVADGDAKKIAHTCCMKCAHVYFQAFISSAVVGKGPSLNAVSSLSSLFAAMYHPKWADPPSDSEDDE